MRTLLAIAILATLAACSAERRPPATQDAPAPDATASAAPAATPAPEASLPEPGEAGDTPVASDPNGADTQATFAGYGDVKFGTLAADMEKAWGGELKTLGKDANPGCYFMTPVWVKTPAEFNFMVSEGKFARVGTDSARYAAPGGGKVGMSEAELQALYHDALQASPHKYTDGKYLEIAASGVAPTRLVFETDADGKVTEWRVGTMPEVGYVEGCS